MRPFETQQDSADNMVIYEFFLVADFDCEFVEFLHSKRKRVAGIAD
jgi:hypothetical protein